MFLDLTRTLVTRASQCCFYRYTFVSLAPLTRGIATLSVCLSIDRYYFPPLLPLYLTFVPLSLTCVELVSSVHACYSFTHLYVSFPLCLALLTHRS